MPSYRYVAVGADGTKQSGSIAAPSEASARYELNNHRLQVRSLRERKKFSQVEITKKKVKIQEIANLSRQLSAFLKAGVPVIDAMQAIGQETKSKELRAILTEMTAQLRAGDPFSEAVAAHAMHFPAYYPGIVRSAELSGRLDAVLDQLADYIDRDEHTRRRVKSALTYPMVIGVMSIVTVVILIGFVLPRFKVFFESFDAELPMTTKSLLALGDFMETSGWMVAVGFVVFMVLLFLFARSERGHLTRDRLLLKIPVLREVVRGAVVERFCRILSAMVEAGVPISAAMTAAIESTNNRVFNAALIKASTEMLEGRGLAQPIAESNLFPGTVTQMIRVGEETGTLDRQLEVAAEYYEKELVFKLDRLTSLFEPAMIIVMGLIVGFVAVALVQAMYGVYGQSGI
jgi:type IV pilus assembly protein PilC